MTRQAPTAPTMTGPENLRTLSDVFCDWLLQHGISELFIVPGAQVFPFITAIDRNPALNSLITVHELGAAYMADGITRTTGKPAACISIGGPGAGNMLTAAATAAIDDSPVLYITGSSPTTHDGSGAFQDGSDLGSRDSKAFKNIRVNSWQISSPDVLISSLEQAWYSLQAHRPAHVVFPIDIQSEKAGILSYPTVKSSPSRPPVPHDYLDTLCGKIAGAHRPLILAGHRVNTPRLRRLVQRFTEQWHTALISTIGAKGLISDHHPLYLGNAGFAGTPLANQALLDPDVDLLLVLGADLSEHDTLCWDSRCHPADRTIISLDSRTRSGMKTDEDILLSEFTEPLEYMIQAADDYSTSEKQHHYPKINMRVNPQYQEGNLPVLQALDVLQSVSSPESHLFVDSGTLRIFSGQGWKVREAGTFHSASGSAPMGWAIAAGIATAWQMKNCPVVILAGDGSMMMHGMELAAAVSHEVNVTIIVVDNGGQGKNMRLIPKGSTARTFFQSPRIDWPQWAKSLGAHGESANSPQSLHEALLAAKAHKGPSLIAISTDSSEEYPYPEYTISVNRPYLDSARSTF